MLIIDKPAGWTSFDVVGFVRKRSRVKRVGHTGTLDPMATGVLPVCLGRATRLIEYLVGATKTYVAEVTLGVTTDTYDAEGEVLHRRDASHLTRQAVEEALPAFRGDFEQVPPAYSAIKREGVPLYKLARRGETVEVPPRRVTVERLELAAFEALPEAESGVVRLRLEIDCSKGFYVRSLAHDLGERLGVGGMLSGLVRTRVGAFHLDRALGIETLTDAFARDAWRDLLLAPDELLLEWDAAILGSASASRLRNGLTVRFDTPISRPVARCRAYTHEGEFVGVLATEGEGLWRPEKVVG